MKSRRYNLIIGVFVMFISNIIYFFWMPYPKGFLKTVGSTTFVFDVLTKQWRGKRKSVKAGGDYSGQLSAVWWQAYFTDPIFSLCYNLTNCREHAGHICCNPTNPRRKIDRNERSSGGKARTINVPHFRRVYKNDWNTVRLSAFGMRGRIPRLLNSGCRGSVGWSDFGGGNQRLPSDFTE